MKLSATVNEAVADVKSQSRRKKLGNRVLTRQDGRPEQPDVLTA